MQLLLIRHGQTDVNAEHRYLGALDPELNAFGVAQAVALNGVLPADLAAVVCSPLRRARQTADLLCLGRACSPVVHAAFRERNVGIFEGLTQTEARQQFPALWAQNVTRTWDAAPPGGETIQAVVDRVHHGLRELYAAYAGQQIALVAHGFVAKVVRAVSHAGFEDFFDWQLGNGAVYQLAWMGLDVPPVGSADYTYFDSKK
ncbi:phosphoglycerate mutase GpmB [Comamonadaceae bacterium OS-1]|nr:phosphoglycerate mutase GpmB [Comamonadaceae bacterium OS-1]